MAAWEVMDAHVWSAFPLELLLDQVLPRLPLLDRLRLRPVCKKWSTVLLSNSYLKHCSATSASSFLAVFDRMNSDPPHPDSELSLSMVHDALHTWLDPFTYWLNSREDGPEMTALLYDHVEDSWHPLSRLLMYRINMNNCVPITSSGGLLCFQNLNDGDLKRLRLVVCNPLLDEWMDIPEVDWQSCLRFMFADHLYLSPKQEGPGFFLALAATKVSPSVFDSATRCWTQIPRSLFPRHRSGFSKAIIISGIAYFLALDDMLSEMCNPFLLRYDIIHQETSICHPLSKKTCEHVTRQLFELYGQVVMMGFDGKNKLCMWTYDISISQWRLLQSIPSPPWGGEKYLEFCNFRVFQNQNLFYFYDPCGDCDCDDDDCSHEHILAYEQFDRGCDIFDVKNNQWKQMSNVPYEGFGQQKLTFVPTLHGIFEGTSRKRKYEPEE